MKKILLIALSLSLTIIYSGCSGGSLQVPGITEFQVDSKLPAVELTKNGVVVEMNEIAFEWKPINDPNVEGVKIYRSSIDANATTLIATIENRYATHYVDLDVKPDEGYLYTLRTYRGDFVSAHPKKIKVYSKPPLNSVAWIYSRNGLPRMAKLLWRPHNNEAVKYYIVERKAIDEDKWNEVARLRGRLQAEYIDTGLKDRFTYRYRVRVETFDGIVSTPSEIVKVVTKPLPPQITGLQASTDLPRRIFLTWNKSHYKDFERYYLYRSKSKDGAYELIAKLYNNRFSDEIDEDGAKYFYKVSQKDIDGLESKMEQIVMGSTLPKPAAPTISEAKFDGSKIVLKWFKVDPRSKKYIIKREAKSGWFDTKVDTFKTSKREFIDTDITPKTTYSYEVYAVDANGIKSLPSTKVEVEVSELKIAPSKAKKVQKSSKKENTQSQSVAPIELEMESL